MFVVPRKLPALLATAVLLTQSVVGSAPKSTEPPRVRAAPGWVLFAGTNVPPFRVNIDSTNLRALRGQPRNWARCTVRYDTNVLTDVGVHIKGSQGSLQSIDERPSLTLSFNKFVEGRKFFGLKKLHFNNTAEDPSFMTEVVCGEFCRHAGLPAARSAHATLTLNDRPLGLYVIKEGLTREFLAQYFNKTDGVLYDGGFQVDIDQPMEVIGGDETTDQADRRALVAAARETDPARRWERLQKVLDMDRFLTLLAMSTLTWNWDGYPMERNNFRVYHDPETDRMVFIPHGLDQMFWEPQGTIYPRTRGLVARAVMSTPEGRARYEERLATVLTNAFRPELLTKRVNELAALIQPYKTDAPSRAVELNRRITLRAQSVAAQLRMPGPRALQFTNGVAVAGPWEPLGDTTATVDHVATTGTGKIMRVLATQPSQASWLLRTTLPAGNYEFVARAQAVRLDGSIRGRRTGAGLRVQAGDRTVTARLNRLGEWEQIRCRFFVRSSEEIVELACELVGLRGELWFDPASLQLRRQESSFLENLLR